MRAVMEGRVRAVTMNLDVAWFLDTYVPAARSQRRDASMVEPVCFVNLE